MEHNKTACKYLMKVGPVYPGLLDNSEGDERVLTAQYTCIKTTSPVGPDNNVADPDECNPSRPCFKEY